MHYSQTSLIDWKLFLLSAADLHIESTNARSCMDSRLFKGSQQFSEDSNGGVSIDMTVGRQSADFCKPSLVFFYKIPE